MHPFYREIELFKPVSDYFISQGYTIRREVRIGYCRADLIACKQNEVIAVELKLRDRKKAIVQALNYQIGADYVYLAFPLQHSLTVLRKAEHQLKKQGIGLLVVNEKTVEVTELIPAQYSKKKFISLTTQEIDRKRKNRKSKYKL